MRDAEDFNTGGSMEQTPIEKAIAEFNRLKVKSFKDAIYLNGVLAVLDSILPYEKKRDRSIAEKAWDACWECKNKCDLDNNEDKQTYLDQNYPLKSKEVTSNLPGIDNKDVKPSNPQLVKETI